MIAPRRAIGVPCAETRMIVGAAIGSSDFDSGAVIVSHRNRSSSIAAKNLKNGLKRRRGASGGSAGARGIVGTGWGKTGSAGG
jgi:hypothetical protein